MHPVAAALLCEPVVVGLPGATLPADRLADELQDVRARDPVPDDDKAGNRFADDAVEELPAAGIACSRLPLAGRDLTEHLAAAEDRAEALAEAIAAAEPGIEAPLPRAATLVDDATHTLDAPTHLDAGVGRWAARWFCRGARRATRSSSSRRAVTVAAAGHSDGR